MQRLQQAVDSYHGDFLAAFFLADSAAFEEWMLLKRAWFHQHALAAFTQLASYHEQRGAYAHAQQRARQQLALDPWREESHRQLMRVLALDGQRSAALMQYATCQRVLDNELGVEPEPETTALYTQIQRGEVVPAVRARPTSNLGAHTPPTPLIGREVELAQLAERIEDRHCRLLTLVGTGGIGKTRLALQAASELATSFRDGVCFVALAPLRSAEFVVPAIAGALGHTFTNLVEPKAQLLAFLRAKALLLVLDNVEHLPGVALLVSELLATSPELTILATGRAPLHVRGEHQFSVPSLQLPNLAQLPDRDELSQYAAVALFVSRAQAVEPAFQMTAVTAPIVATMCARLDGLALAIELAAARSKLFPPAALLARLHSPLAVLTDGAHDLPARQQTMRATIDWSYRLLAPEQQQLLARLGVFVGGWTLAAVEAVGGAGDQAVLAGLDVLLQHSLVRRIETEHEPRYTLLETIHEYALERLEASGEADTIRRWHAEHYLALAEMAGPHLYGQERDAWLDRLEREHDNLRAALRWALEGGDREIGAGIAIALIGRDTNGLWSRMGYWGEADRWLAAVVAQRDALAPGIRAWVLVLAALSRGRLVGNPYKEQRTVLDEARVLFRTAGDRSGIAYTLWSQGLFDVYGGDSRAIQFVDEGLALYQELGDHYHRTVVLSFLGFYYLHCGDAARATALLGESLALSRKHGYIRETAQILNALGAAACIEGDLPRATAFYWDALLLIQDERSFERVWPLTALAYLALVQGDDGRVLALLQQQGKWFQETAVVSALIILLPVLGMLVNAHGDSAQAIAILRDGLILQQQFQEQDVQLDSLEAFAGVAVGQGQAVRATCLLGAAEALRTTSGLRRGPAARPAYVRDVATARAALGDEAFDAAWAAGQALTLEQVIAEALAEPQRTDLSTATG